MIVRKVFISSTTRDLAQYRRVATEVINTVTQNYGGNFSLIPIHMDMPLNGERDTPQLISRSWVEEADWVVLVVAWNYGYVPLDQEFSVTEMEYQQAIKSDKKKCFVFLPGDGGDPDDYRYIGLKSERPNLRKYLDDVDPLSLVSLNSFKDKLRRSSRFKLFTDIDHFREMLASALTLAVMEEIFERLDETLVALGLRPYIEKCVSQVKSLAKVKKVHDYLHQIRQFGIQQWRENILAAWPETNEPTAKMVADYFRKRETVMGLLRDIAPIALELELDLNIYLRQTTELTMFRLKDPTEGSRESFIESINKFASLVQNAFTGCNNQMKITAAALDRAMQNLNQSTTDAIKQNPLGPEQEALLVDELRNSLCIHRRLQSILINHDEWQFIHDRLEMVDSDAEVDGAEIVGALKLESKIQAALTDASAILEKYPDSVDLLDQWPALIERVKMHLENFVKSPTLSLYQALRKSFDNLFFKVDKETRRIVELSESRVKAIEAGLKIRGRN